MAWLKLPDAFDQAVDLPLIYNSALIRLHCIRVDAGAKTEFVNIILVVG